MPAAEWFEFSSFSPNAGIRFFAKARRTLGDNVKHWLELGRRGADDPQNLSHRRLLLQRLGLSSN
jgi:hypothetical protein